MRLLLTMLMLTALACGGGTQTTHTGGTGEVSDDEAPRHAVRIHRGLSADQRLNVVVDAHQFLNVMVEGAEQEVAGLSEELRLHLEAEVTVHEVDEEGRAARATLVVQTFVDPESGAEIMPTGATIVAERGDDGLEIGLVDGELTDDQALLLDLAFPLQRPGSPLGDELFGTDTPRAVGETWPVDTAFLVEDLTDEGFGIQETSVTGEVKLANIHECAVGQCMQIEAEAHATQSTIAQLAEEADFESGELNATVQIIIPVDESLPATHEEAMVTGTFSASFQVDGAAVQRQLAVSRLRRATYTPATATP